MPAGGEPGRHRAVHAAAAQPVGVRQLEGVGHPAEPARRGGEGEPQPAGGRGAAGPAAAGRRQPGPGERVRGRGAAGVTQQHQGCRQGHLQGHERQGGCQGQHQQRPWRSVGELERL